MGHDKDHAIDSAGDHTAASDTTDCDAQTTKHGLMPKTDKVKLNAIAAGAQVGNCSIVVGAYTGDGSEDQEVDTGINDQIQSLQIVRRCTNNVGDTENIFYSWDDGWTTKCYCGYIAVAPSNGEYLVDDCIIALGVDGKFHVADRAGDLDPNKNGVVYSYVALIG